MQSYILDRLDSPRIAIPGHLACLLLSALIITGTALPLSAAQSIGQVVLLEGKAEAKVSGGTSRQLNMQSEIFLNDRIETGAGSKVQLMFEDDSVISQGPNSSMVIDEFVYDPKTKARNSSKSRMMKGVFRVITGKITELNPDKFKLKTRSATIGIRGCEIALIVGEDMQEDQVMIFEVPPEGSIVIETTIPGEQGSETIVARNPGMSVFITPRGGMRQGNIGLGEARRVMRLATPDPRAATGQDPAPDTGDPLTGTAPVTGEPVTGGPATGGTGPTLMAGAPHSGGQETFTGLEVIPVLNPTVVPDTAGDSTGDAGTTGGDPSGVQTDGTLTLDGVILEGGELGGIITDLGVVNDGQGTDYTLDDNGDVITSGGTTPSSEGTTILDITDADTSAGTDADTGTDGGLVIGSLTVSDPDSPAGDTGGNTILDPDSPAPPSGTSNDAPPPPAGDTGGNPPPTPVFNLQSAGTDWDWGVWTLGGNYTAIGWHGNTINALDFQAIAAGATLHTLTGNGTSGALIDHLGNRSFLSGTAVIDVQVGMNLAPSWAGSFNLSNGGGDTLAFGSVGSIQTSGDLTGSRTTYSMMVNGSSFGGNTIGSENIGGKLVGPGSGPTPITGAVGDFMFDHGGGTVVDGVFGSDLAPGTPQN